MFISLAVFQCRSSLFLKQFTDVASTASCGRLFQLVTTRMLKKCCLTVDRLLGTNNFRLWPRVLYLDTCNLKKSSLFKFSLPDKILYVSIRSPRSLHFSSVVSPSFFSLSSYGNFFRLSTSLVARRWILSKQSISLQRC